MLACGWCQGAPPWAAGRWACSRIHRMDNLHRHPLVDALGLAPERAQVPPPDYHPRAHRCDQDVRAVVGQGGHAHEGEGREEQIEEAIPHMAQVKLMRPQYSSEEPQDIGYQGRLAAVYELHAD